MVESGADEIEIWGTGKAERDFLYIEDCCDAVIAIMEREDSFGVYNVSSGRRTTIRDLAEIIRNESGFTGKMVFNPEYPDGQSTRVMSTRRLDDLGWKPTIDLTEGIKRTIAWCQENPDSWRIAGS
jgi:GDP-L-fucose synthase